jgi:hypothetical protein
MSDEKKKAAPYEPVILTLEKLAELEETHGEDNLLVMKGTERAPFVVALRRPDRKETIAYKDHAKRNSATANEQLLRKISVFPTGDDLEKQLARWPFLPDGVCDSAVFRDFVGIAVDESVK